MYENLCYSHTNNFAVLFLCILAAKKRFVAKFTVTSLCKDNKVSPSLL